MRLMKIIGWVLGGIAALLALAIAWLLLWFDPNQYKPQIERLVQANTGRTLALKGKLNLSFWPSLAVELGEATLGNAPGFGDAPMLSVKQVRLGVKVLPLLHKRFEIGAVELDSPVVVLIKKSEQSNNWSDLGKQEETSAPQDDQPAAAANLNASVESVSIKNASVSYDDQLAHTQTQLKNFSLSTGQLQPGKPVTLASSFTLIKVAADHTTQSLDFKLTTRLDADMDAKRYVLAEPTIDLVVKQANGQSLPVSIKATALNADLQAQTADVTALTLAVGDLKLVADFKVTKLVDAPEVNGQLTLSPFSPRAVAKQFAIKLPVSRDPNVLGQLSMQGQLKATTKSAALSALTMKLDDTTLRGSLAVTDIDSKALRFDLDVDRINMDRYLSPVAEQPKEAPAADTGPVAIPGDAIRGLNIQGELTAGQVVMSKVELSHVRLNVDARNNKLQLNPLQATVYEGKFNGNVLLDATGKVPRVALEEHVAGVNFAPLFKALYDTQRVSGRGNVNLKLAGSGANSDALKRTLSGTLDFNVDNGAYEGVDLWYEIRRARALLRQQPIPAQSAKPRTPFTALRGSGVMTNGMLSNQDLNAALQYLKATGQGKVDLVNSNIDYRLQATVMQFPSETKLASGAQDNGEDLVGLSIPITITGALADPKVRPDVSALLKERAKQELQKQKDKVEEKLKDQLKDKLRGLFGG